MIPKEKVHSVIMSAIDGTSIFLVDIRIDTANRISVEVDKPEGITIEECVNISRAIESSLDREVEDYELEVSSPGLTEAFKVVEQYHKNLGRMVDVLKKDGQKVNGQMQSVDDYGILLEVKMKVREEGKKRSKIIKQPVPIKYEDIKATKVIITF